MVRRRSAERVGTRLFVRGADAEGKVANYVETEQIVEVRYALKTNAANAIGMILVAFLTHQFFFLLKVPKM